jgi:hypothetical protein
VLSIRNAAACQCDEISPLGHKKIAASQRVECHLYLQVCFEPKPEQSKHEKLVAHLHFPNGAGALNLSISFTRVDFASRPRQLPRLKLTVEATQAGYYTSLKRR